MKGTFPVYVICGLKYLKIPACPVLFVVLCHWLIVSVAFWIIERGSSCQCEYSISNVGFSNHHITVDYKVSVNIFCVCNE